MKSKRAIPLLLAGTLLFGAYAAGGQQTPLASNEQPVHPSPNNSAAAPSSSDVPIGQSTASDTRAATSSSAAQDQSSIAAKIKSEMAAQNVASLPDITVETDSSGAVVLSGTAQSQEDVDKALSIARGTAGVTSVRNDITVKTQG